MLHEVVQACLSEGKWDDVWIDQRIDEVVSRELNDLVRINVSEAEARREVKARARGLRGFADKYVSPLPKVN
jgi:DNA replication ATP-dependent helicase Dna2